MRAYDIIHRKRDGHELSAAELEWFVAGFTQRGDVTDYQAAAFLMAVFFRGMTGAELGHWTKAMLHSGVVLDLSEIPGTKVDKHSTGGVGDKVSLPLAPLLAEAGVVVPMISGRGLGHTGGTLDKLEAIPGFRTDLNLERFRAQLAKLGVCMIGQTAEIAPADKKLYALRDVTATVECIPLIASSIMSKKLAEGIQGLVLDVKTGRGAFMSRYDDARTLAQTMISIGRAMNTQVVAWITSMEQPLGRTVGNALEVEESIDILRGTGPDDLLDVTLTLGAEMLQMAGLASDRAQAITRLQALIENGAALRRFQQMIEAQGGDPRVVDDYQRLPQASQRRDVVAPRGGFVHGLDALSVGQAARMLGAGRATMADSVDYAAGIRLHRKVGEPVEAGEPIATLLASQASLFDEPEALLGTAIVIESEPVAPPRLLLERVATGLRED